MVTSGVTDYKTNEFIFWSFNVNFQNLDERKEEIRILKKQVDKSLKKKKDIEEEIKKEKSESAKIQREVNAVEKKCEDKNNKLNVSNTLRVVPSANKFHEP